VIVPDLEVSRGPATDLETGAGRGRVWIPATVVLAVAYFFTLAPTVTFWDAGEFIAAARTLGVPHPPGTPLFIVLLHAWGLPWPDGQYAFALNMFSAVATLGAAGLSAILIHRWLRRGWNGRTAFAAATAAAICAGAMYTVWSNATETEVYAASLALAIVTLVAADRGKEKLVAYCFGLAAALHVSALVAAPAAVMLAAARDDDVFDSGVALWLGAAALAAMAIGTWNPWVGVAAAIVTIGAVLHPERRERKTIRLAWIGGATVLGASALLFMLVRARFDPGINQGNASTWSAFADVIARRQYDLAPLWPRRAPLWIQIGNWFEYADWQTALSLGPSVVPTVQRILVTIGFASLAVIGAVEHRRLDRRSWRAMLVLFLSGTIGVTLYLNLRASPSFGWGVLPDGALREARERDYFFVLGFWACGLWAGIGAVSVALSRRVPVIAGVAVAALPIALNWSAVTRRREPDARLARAVASGLVETLPQRTVLFVAGDNDTYPVWFAREVFGLRPDVTLVTVPLVGASWYADELIRRNPDLARARTMEGITPQSIADAARGAGRPVAASITLDKADRLRLNGCWRVIGMVVLDDVSGANCLSANSRTDDDFIPVDSAGVANWIRLVPAKAMGQVKPSIDPVSEYFSRALDCPRKLLATSLATRRGVSLDSTCKL
jgi:hypothetical protein